MSIYTEELGFGAFLHEVKIQSGIGDDGIEYVNNLRTNDPILDSYISSLEKELEEILV